MPRGTGAAHGQGLPEWLHVARVLASAKRNLLLQRITSRALGRRCPARIATARDVLKEWLGGRRLRDRRSPFWSAQAARIHAAHALGQVGGPAAGQGRRPGARQAGPLLPHGHHRGLLHLTGACCRPARRRRLGPAPSMVLGTALPNGYARCRMVMRAAKRGERVRRGREACTRLAAGRHVFPVQVDANGQRLQQRRRSQGLHLRRRRRGHHSRCAALPCAAVPPTGATGCGTSKSSASDPVLLSACGKFWELPGEIHRVNLWHVGPHCGPPLRISPYGFAARKLTGKDFAARRTGKQLRCPTGGSWGPHTWSASCAFSCHGANCRQSDMRVWGGAQRSAPRWRACCSRWTACRAGRKDGHPRAHANLISRGPWV